MSSKTALRQIQVWTLLWTQNRLRVPLLLRFFALVTWGCISPAQILWLSSRPIQRQNVHRLWLFICCKTKLKKIFFFEKIFVFFTKYTLFAEKNVFIWKKSFIMKMFFTEKNFFYRENYKWKFKKDTSHFRNIFLYKKCLCYK